jgi:thioredoxin-like negative regulator of GroEL
MSDADTAASAPLWLACLCAGWCRTCDAYQPVLEQVAAEFKARLPQLKVRWIDIEDESDLVGDCDIQTFPTLAIVDPEGVRFFGTVTPHAETLARLLRSHLSEDEVSHQSVPPEVAALAAQLRAGA